jgi:hypothetical protein
MSPPKRDSNLIVRRSGIAFLREAPPARSNLLYYKPAPTLTVRLSCSRRSDCGKRAQAAIAVLDASFHQVLLPRLPPEPPPQRLCAPMRFDVQQRRLKPLHVPIHLPNLFGLTGWSAEIWIGTRA